MSKKPKNKGKLTQKLTDKYRLVVLNENTFEERFSLKLSRLNVFVLGGLLAFLLILITTFIITFTPIKEYIPGYSSTNLKIKATKLASLILIRAYRNSVQTTLNNTLKKPYLNTIEKNLRQLCTVRQR